MTLTWFERNEDALVELFEILGVDAPVEDAEALARWCELEGWYAEHGRQPGKPIFPADTVSAAMQVLRRIGLDGQVDPPSETYDELVVMGAAGIGMHRRIGLVVASQVRSPLLTVLAGMRPHEGSGARPGSRTNDGRLSELLAKGGRFEAEPDWEPHPLHLHQAQLLTGVDDYAAGAVVFPSESDLATLSLAKHFPASTLSSTEHGLPHPVVNELGQRSWVRRTWMNPPSCPIERLAVQNSQPVARHNMTTGEPIASRPTATSTVHEWIDHHEAHGTFPASVLLVVNQPHLGRVYSQVRSVLRERGLTALGVDVAGCATMSEVDINLLLGEIPRWIRAEAMS